MAKILIVDDDGDVRKLITCVLTRAGHDVAEAANGQEALAKLAQDKFDLVLCDNRIPLMGGMKLVARIRQMDSPPKIVMMGSGAIPEGYNGTFIQKPIIPLSTLVDEVARTLARAE